MTLPTLPARAAYLHLRNPARRNALSLSVLRDLKSQLLAYNTSPVTGRPQLLPPFRPEILDKLERLASRDAEAQTNPPVPTANATENDHEGAEDLSWLLTPQSWHRHRGTLPTALVLRPDPGPAFSSGHDLGELSSLPTASVRQTFALCADVMTLLRRSPAPVVSAVSGLATAAGAQLALSADVTIARADASFRLPGAGLGLPCSSPATAIARRAGVAAAARMLFLGEPVAAGDAVFAGALDVVAVPEHAEARDTAAEAFEGRVKAVVDGLVGRAAQPAALAKWAFWTQVGIRGEADGYAEALDWAGRVMALHAGSADAREGMSAFLEKRRPVWGS